MPPAGESPEQVLQAVVDHVGRYPTDAFLFVQAALYHTAEHHHGPRPTPKTPEAGTATVDANHPDADHPDADDPDAATRHITGGQLCHGIRDYALRRWGRLARPVLGRWGVTETLDFGRIVFALVDAGLLSKTDDDRLDDFAAVFDFADALERDYEVPCKLAESGGDAA